MIFKIRRIRHKLLLAYSIVFILSISLGSIFIYLAVRRNIKTTIEGELNNATQAILSLVRASAAVSIKNHLRAVAEKNLELIHHYYEKSVAGVLTRAQAQQQVAELLLSQTIGKSGYIYCMNSAGRVTVHPQNALINSDVSNFKFVKEQLRLKKGYIEYNWKNPGDDQARPKALYMLYFEPWDWIISVSSYRREFMDLVNVEDFRKAVLEMDLGRSGYAFVIDGQGTAVISTVLITLMLVLLITFKISASITDPLRRLSQHLSRMGTRPTEREIIDFCKQNLARFKAPKVVEFSALPKTATGKIQKFKLRDKEWQGRPRRVN